MQTIIDFSKYLVIIVLSCSLLTTWYATETEVINQIPTTYYDGSEGTNGSSGSSDIWRSMSREFKLDTRAQTAQVQAEIRKLLAEGRLNEILEAAMPHIYFIHKQTQARGLPAELALIPDIESEFNLYDHSRVGATG